MLPDKAFLLAAGKGTRMGDLSKKIPKILLPVFEITLLECLVDFLNYLGIFKIYINVHHLSDEIRNYITTKKDLSEKITIIYEKELLDVGGSIYNFALQESVNYQGKALVISADQLFFFNKKEFIQKCLDFSREDVVLFETEVRSDRGFNQIIKNENNYLIDIIKYRDCNNLKKTYFTYSGYGVIDLSKLEKKSGIFPFFNSIANYKTKKVKVERFSNFEHWDFGEISRFKDSYFSIMEKFKEAKDNFLEYSITKTKIIDQGKINMDMNIYGNSLSLNTINLSSSLIENKSSGEVIVLKNENLKRKVFNLSGIYYDDLFVPFSKDNNK